MLGRDRAVARPGFAAASFAGELGERALKAGEVRRLAGGCDLELVCDLLGAVDDAGEAADDEIGDPVSFECCEDRVRVELARARRPSPTCWVLARSIRSTRRSGERSADLRSAGERVVVALGEFEREVVAADGE